MIILQKIGMALTPDDHPNQRDNPPQPSRREGAWLPVAVLNYRSYKPYMAYSAGERAWLRLFSISGGIPKDALLEGKRPPFSVQKTAFCSLKDGLLECRL